MGLITITGQNGEQVLVDGSTNTPFGVVFDREEEEAAKFLIWLGYDPRGLSPADFVKRVDKFRADQDRICRCGHAMEKHSSKSGCLEQQEQSVDDESVDDESVDDEPCDCLNFVSFGLHYFRDKT